MLNLLYVLNISFFALVVRDSWLMRKKYHPSGFNHCKHRIDLNAANRSFENCKYFFVTDIRSVLMQETLRSSDQSVGAKACPRSARSFL